MKYFVSVLMLLIAYSAFAQPATPPPGAQTAINSYCWNGSTVVMCTTQPIPTNGTDYSVNAASVPMSGLILLVTIPATPSRVSAEVQNQSANTIQLVRDDGAGNNQTSLLLSSGGVAGSQGGGWSSTTFRGRIRVYGVTGSQIAADQE